MIILEYIFLILAIIILGLFVVAAILLLITTIKE